MANEKNRKTRMVLNAKDMPEDVYKILSSYSQHRMLTPYIIDLVRNRESVNMLLKRLDIIENKIDNSNFKENIIKDEHKFTHRTNITEGKVIEEINSVKGGINPSEITEIDF